MAEGVVSYDSPTAAAFRPSAVGSGPLVPAFVIGNSLSGVFRCVPQGLGGAGYHHAGERYLRVRCDIALPYQQSRRGHSEKIISQVQMSEHCVGKQEPGGIQWASYLRHHYMRQYVASFELVGHWQRLIEQQQLCYKNTNLLFFI